MATDIHTADQKNPLDAGDPYELETTDFSNFYLLGVARRRPVATLREATFDPDLYEALKDWRYAADIQNLVLIGRLALNFHLKPRYATTAAFFSLEPVRQTPNGFREAADGIFWHEKSGSIISIVTAAQADITIGTAQKVLATACHRDCFGVASREAMIALRLSVKRSWRKHRDYADIIDLLVGQSSNMSNWGLGPELLQVLIRCRTMADAIC